MSNDGYVDLYVTNFSLEPNSLFRNNGNETFSETTFAAGVGKIGIVDFDVVDFTNLQRQIVHSTADVGRPKLDSARDRLSGINPGWVSRVVDNLLERGLIGYSRRNGIELLRGEDALKEWADMYDWRRNKFYYYYCHAMDIQEVLDKIGRLKLSQDKACALGFQAGAYLVAPHAAFNQVHLLVDGFSFDIIRSEVEQQLELELRREGANLVLVRPYYKRSAIFDARKIKNWWIVSDVQLYLDLNRYPLRGQEQAEHLFEKVIQPAFDKMKRGSRGSKQD